jgi:tetratricopeptide (TPR) repeat protein
MLTRFLQRRPVPPGAGRKKVVHPREVARGWLTALAIVGLVGVAAWPLGLGQSLEQMRRQALAAGYLRSAEQLATGQPVQREQALAALTRAQELAGELPALAEKATALYVSLEAYDEALIRLQSRPPADLMSRVSLGQCLLLTGRQPQGMVVLEEAVREAMQQVKDHQLPQRGYALVLNNVGYVYTLAGERLDLAREYIEAAVNIEPLQPAYADSLGWIEYQQGEYRNAAFYLERAVRLQWPVESAEMNYHLGVVYARLGRLHEARQLLERTLELDPGWRDAQQAIENLGQCLPPPQIG